MVYRMWILKVDLAEQLAQNIWEVEATKVEAAKVRQVYPGRQTTQETLMIQDIGLVSTARMPMLSQLPFVKFVISADEPLILNIHGCCLLSQWEE